MWNERDECWSSEIFLDGDSVQEGCHKLVILLEGGFCASVKSSAHLPTKRHQHVPVHCNPLSTPISPIVDVMLILPKDFIREVRDDICTKWLRKLRFSVVYHRRQRNNESSAFLCPFDDAGLRGGEDIFVPLQHQEEATTFTTNGYLLFLRDSRSGR